MSSSVPIDLILALVCYVGAILLRSLLRSNPRKNVYAVVFAFVLFVHFHIAASVWNLMNGHDTAAHLQYIEFFIHTHSLPPPLHGWEFHQPPLYYILAAVVELIGANHWWSILSGVMLLRSMSCLLSLATWGLSVWIAVLLFPAKKLWSARVFFILVIGVFPALIYGSANVSNDVLEYFLFFAATAVLLQWWKMGGIRRSFQLAIVVGLGILTKLTAFLLVPVIVACFLVHPKLRGRRKSQAGILMLVTLIALCGVIVPRAFVKYAAPGAHARLLDIPSPVPNTPAALLTFNPIRVLSPDLLTSRLNNRPYFLEYFFRTALLGEWPVSGLRRAIAPFLAASALCLLFLCLLGVEAERRNGLYDHLPLHLLLLMLLAGAFAYRIYIPDGPNQDFRFVAPMVVPLTFLAIRGAQSLHGSWRRVAAVVGILFIVTAALESLLLT